MAFLPGKRAAETGQKEEKEGMESGAAGFYAP